MCKMRNEPDTLTEITLGEKNKSADEIIGGALAGISRGECDIYISLGAVLV